MAIKDQCYSCISYSGFTCSKKNSSPEFNSTTCDFYKKRGIVLDKPGDDVWQNETVHATQQSHSNAEDDNNRQTKPSVHQSMFNKPFSFDGRIRRLEYGLTYVAFVAYDLLSDVLMEPDEPSLSACLFVLITIIPVLWVLFAQGAKRCHDLGHSGWYQIIPFYGIWMLFVDGESGDNQYGYNPKS